MKSVKQKLIKLVHPGYTVNPPPEVLPPPPPFGYNIDIVSGCNLRCAACPVGMPEYSNSIGMGLREMDLNTFEQICIKALKDTHNNCMFNLYNWTEPTLHSRLDELVAIANHYNIPCGLSSNLNHDYDWSLLQPLELSHFTVTVSGFTQKTYAINHKGGRIEPVLRNLVAISEVLADTPVFRKFTIRYLVHKENKHEASIFRHFAQKLGFNFEFIHAYYMPIDQVFKGLDEVPEGLEYIEYSPRKVQASLEGYRTRRCILREQQTALDVDGNIRLCCAERPTASTLGSYLHTPFAAMQKSRFSSELCKACIGEGINIMLTYAVNEPEHIQQSFQSALPFNLNSL